MFQAKYLIASIVAFSITFGFLILFSSGSKNEVYCFPYLKTVFGLQKEYTRKLIRFNANPNVVKELDLRLKALNEKVKNFHGFLIDCSFCLGCEKVNLNR